MKCPKCNSSNLSDGKNDFLIVNGFEKLFQFCHDCHAEWFLDVPISDEVRTK